MPKPSKRYETSQAICRRIDAEKRRAADLRVNAINFQERFDFIRKSGTENLDDLNEMEWCRKQAEKLFKRADRIESTTLSKLSAKLAEFNTGLLPGCGDDRSVAVR